MTDSIPIGSRVRVTYEATYDGRQTIGHSVGRNGDAFFAPLDAIVEVVAPPDPLWWPPQLGDVALFCGMDWKRYSTRWRSDAGERTDDQMRDADLIVRDGRRCPIVSDGLGIKDTGSCGVCALPF